MTYFSLVIPLFNEEKNIENLVKEIFFYLNEIKNFELILVNDGSLDNTNLTIKKLKSFYNIKIIENNKNYGQSFSLKVGIENSKFKTIVTLDGDGQNNPKDILKLLNHYNSNKEILLVGGIRKNRKDNFIKIISSKIANNIRSLILNDQCRDTGCSLKVFDKDVFLSFPFFDGIHRFLPALYKGFGKKTYFIYVDHRPRKYGISKYGTFDRIFGGVRDLIRVVKIIKKFKEKRV